LPRRVPMIPNITIVPTPKVEVTAIPNITVASLPDVDVATMPNVVVATMPNVNVATMPNVNVATMPNVNVATMPNVNVATMPLTSVEEQYQLQERKALAVDTGGQNYPITTTSPKVVTLIADGCDMYIDTAAIGADSPKILNSASISFTLKGAATTIYAKAVSGSGTLYIMVYK